MIEQQQESARSGDIRAQSLQAWLQDRFENDDVYISLLAGDASFRRYFRACIGGQNYIAMDAPPEKETCVPFVGIANAFRECGVNTPKIYAQDIEQGFLLLSDFGDRLYLGELTGDVVDDLYQRAFDALLTLQSCENSLSYQFPLYNTERYTQEMELCRHWYLGEHLGVQLSVADNVIFDEAMEQLIKSALNQLQVCVHRDYHSRNLIVCDDGQVGVLDFQDAVWGPITYDLVSLLKDCYIDWPPEKIERWVLHYQQQLIERGVLQENNPQEFLRWFDLMGLQRHLKCLGIFSRLHLRDGKPDYLQYLPRVLRYVNSVCARYPEFAKLSGLLFKH